jgi:hypothetical protein
VHVLRRFREAVVQDGILLDLQVIRPHPRIESEGRLVYVADGSPLFKGVGAARAAVDLLIAEGLLVEDAVDDHDVHNHYDSGADLLAGCPPKRAKPGTEAAAFLRAITVECIVRERCRLRKLRRVG